MSDPAAAHLLTRTSHRARPEGGVRFLSDLCLARARVHEACGGARHTFALMVMAATQGPVIWIAPGRQSAGLHPDGISRFMDPGRLILVRPRRDGDLLWSMEEALRAGAVALVVADLPGPPALTPIRRLHLAAETGAKEGAVAPLGLILTPGEGGAPGIESRWDMQARHGAVGRRAWKLERRRERMAPEATWQVGLNARSFQITPQCDAGAPIDAAPASERPNPR